jgi:hypothetical protein
VGQLTSLITGKLIAFDTGPLIYYIEEHPDYLSRADELFSAFDSGAALGMTSVLTLQEESDLVFEAREWLPPL